jgi:hypothetical protein
MSRVRRCLVGVPLVVLVTLAMSASAQAQTLGNTTMPIGSTAAPCTDAGSDPVDALQVWNDADYAYTVPAGGGAITSWSFNTAGATPGTPYGLIVAQPSGDGSYTVVGTDNEVVPLSPPPVASFPLAAPILVQGGDVIGVVVAPTFASDCGWTGGPLTGSDLTDLAAGDQTVGGSLTSEGSQADELLNVSVNLEQDEDVAVTQQALPGSIVAGGESVFLLSVTNGGPASVPVNLEDAVPTGLTIDSVDAGAGSCTISGQDISCTLPSAPASVAVVVSATSAGDYGNAAAVSTSLPDPNPANNVSSATLDVAALQACHLFSLTGLTLADAKTVIRAMGCNVGSIKTKSSKSVPKGSVISISPGSGRTVAIDTNIAIVVSSGEPKKKPTLSHR